VVAAGGDGTVRPIAQALVGTPLRFGILPVGTDNNFAHSLGIPFELDSALGVLRDGSAQRVDIGRIGNENFTEAAGVGLFANLIAAFGPSGPARCQWLSCLRTAARMFWNPPTYPVRLVLDGVVYEEDVTMVSVCNSAYLGESWAIAPDARLDDGLFDVVIVSALSRLELVGFTKAILQGAALTYPKVSRIRAKTVEISSNPARQQELPIHADDHISAYTPARFETVPRALSVITTRRSLT
jgi:YegS/Rv2252/BmrU family lipid kinase